MRHTPRHRLRNATLAVLSVCTAGAVFVTATSAGAHEARSATAAARSAAVIERATGTTGIVPSTFRPDGSARALITDQGLSSTITAPSAADGTVTAAAEDGTEVGIGLPGEPHAAVSSERGTIVYPDADSDTGVGVQPTDTGVRALVTLRDADAPVEYRFPLDLPEGAVTEQLEDGSILVSVGEEIIGAFDAPWAKDAEGNAVPTDYEIEGSTLVQRVHPQPSTVFPVVADPFWLVPAAIVLGRVLLTQGVKSISRHAATRMAQRGISKEMVERTVKNGKKTKGKTPGTWKFKSGKIWVVVNKDGNVVSVGRN